MGNQLSDQAFLDRMVHFIRDIGIEIVFCELPEATFLPGIQLGPNCIFIDKERMQYPGDLLHEAGHLAVTTPQNRMHVGTAEVEENWPPEGEEMSAILWSYAALLYLDIPAEYVFHPKGYKNESQWMIQNFKDELYIGMPLLEWMGLALSKERAEREGKPAFPQMLKWVRE